MLCQATGSDVIYNVIQVHVTVVNNKSRRCFQCYLISFSFVNCASFLEGTLNYDEELRIQTLRKQRLEPKAIMKTNLGWAEALDR